MDKHQFISRLLKKLGLDHGIVNIGGAHLLTALISGFFWLYLASIMSVSDYGKITFLLAAGAIIGGVSLAGMNVVLVTNLAQGKYKITEQARWLVVFLSFACGIVSIFVLREWIMFPIVVGNTIFTMVQHEFLGISDNRNFFRYSAIQRILQVLSGMGLFYILGSEGILLGYSLSNLVLCFPFFNKLRISQIGFYELRKNYAFSIHGYSVEMSQVLYSYSDKLLIAPLFGYSVAGLYNLSNQFLIFLTMIPSSLYQYILPRESKQIQSTHIIKIGLVISVIISILFFLFAPYVIPILFPHFVNAIPLAEIMIFGLVPLTVTYTVTSRLLASQYSKYVLYGMGSFIVVEYVLIYFLGTIWKEIGLATSLVIALSIQALLMQILYQRSKKHKLS